MNAAQKLYQSLGVDMVMLAQSMRRDPSEAGNAPQSARHMSARQHMLRDKAEGITRKYTKRQHSTLVWDRFENARKQERAAR